MICSLFLFLLPLNLVLPIVIDQLHNWKLVYLVSQNNVDRIQELRLDSHFVLPIAHVFQLFEGVYELLLEAKVEQVCNEFI